MTKFKRFYIKHFPQILQLFLFIFFYITTQQQHTNTMSQHIEKFSIGLNIHLLSFFIPKHLIKPLEEIKICVTTQPEENTQTFCLPIEKMEKSNHVFALNITNQTKKIFVIFRRKNFLVNDPIIASSCIYLSEFPKLTENFADIVAGTINTEVKEYKIFEMSEKSDVIGKMKIQFSFCAPYPENGESKKLNNKNLFQFKPLKIKSIDFKVLDFNSKVEIDSTLDTKYDCYNDYILF